MDSPKHIVLRATHKLLLPLIRILLRYGISLIEFNNLAKQTYIEACDKYYAIPGRKNSASRIAILTGLSRREVVKLQKRYSEESLENLYKEPVNRASRVTGGWLQDKQFLSNSGKPRILPITGHEISFENLVKRYSGDINYIAILNELLSIGAVKKSDDNFVELISEGYIPVTDELEKVSIMGTSASDMLNTVLYNLEPVKHPRFQREIVYTKLSKHSIDEFKLVSREKCAALILDLNDWLGAKWNIEKELERHEEGTRVGIGVYYFEETKDDDVGEEK